MESKVLQFLNSNPLPSIIPVYKNPSSTIKTTVHTPTTVPRRRRSLSLNCTNTKGGNDDTPQPAPPLITSSETVEIRFKRGSRKRNRNRKQSAEPVKAQAVPNPPKKWEDMSLAEKALEVYVGEKGMLFWLNKFAYASIFIVIGGWILFRFVGPSLNLYQLDTPPLSPNNMFKGS
ncbi:hypothetical protein MANES_02G103801v8 [Manihot esculenta]|uniref:Uncharacterized protein n=1 Tax=Manihot esculenta TaxID=3983 RepID=A0ACB7I4M1_MANES|nr:hypothetical protein MANES_02G103801v8 [Manihot esculenta]